MQDDVVIPNYPPTLAPVLVAYLGEQLPDVLAAANWMIKRPRLPEVAEEEKKAYVQTFHTNHFHWGKMVRNYLRKQGLGWTDIELDDFWPFLLVRCCEQMGVIVVEGEAPVFVDVADGTEGITNGEVEA